MHILGFDVGGTKISSVIGTDRGEIIKTVRRRTVKHLGREHLVRQLIDLGEEVKKRANVSSVDRIGIVFAGLVDGTKGIIKTSPNILGLREFNVKTPLEDHFRVNVTLENDATGATIAERLFGRGKDTDNFVYLTLSTGIGGGAFVNGRLLKGSHGLAGEFGHMVIMSNGPICSCGRKGCLEAVAGGNSIARRVSESVTALRGSDILSHIDPDKISAKVVFDAMRKGDMLSRLVIEETIYYLAVGIVNIASILDPDVVIIGGGISNAGNALFRPLRDAIREEFKGMRRPLRVVRGLRRGADLASISVPIFYENNHLP